MGEILLFVSVRKIQVYSLLAARSERQDLPHRAAFLEGQKEHRSRQGLRDEKVLTNDIACQSNDACAVVRGRQQIFGRADEILDH